jgi:hypothetical protein
MLSSPLIRLDYVILTQILVPKCATRHGKPRCTQSKSQNPKPKVTPKCPFTRQLFQRDKELYEMRVCVIEGNVKLKCTTVVMTHVVYQAGLILSMYSRKPKR